MLYCVFALLALSLAAPLLKAPNPEEAVVGRYIIVLKGNSSEHLDEHHLSISNKVQGHLLSTPEDDTFADHLDLHHEFRALVPDFLGYSATLSPEALSMMLDHDDVDYVEQVQIVTASQSCSTQTGAPWGLPRTTVASRSTSSQFTYDSHRGSGVDVYVIDTGIYTAHRDFGGRATWGVDYTNDRGSVDYSGHGTHVAGTVGGTQYGICKSCNLISVKVLAGSAGSGYVDWIVAGINWVSSQAAAKRKTVVSNLSLGSGFSSASNNAVNAAHNTGRVLNVVASGNSNMDACSFSPASASNALSVNSATSADAKSGFSNWGRCTHIWAPGSSILSAYIGSTTSSTYLSGTSMAAPHVAGVAAMYLYENPGQSSSQLRSRMLSTATRSGISWTSTPNSYVYKKC